MSILPKAITCLASIAIAVPAALFAWPTAAHAGYAFYSELAGGLSNPASEQAFFGDEVQGSGTLVSYGIFYKLTSGDNAPQFNVGLLTRGAIYTLTSGSAYVVTPYLVARAQAGILYLGAGIGPAVWRQTSSSTGLSSGSIAALGEGGLLWPIVPNFDLGLGATGTMVSTGGVQSPKPVLDFLLSMRFHFWPEKTGGSGRRGVWDGFRYPLGIWK